MFRSSTGLTRQLSILAAPLVLQGLSYTLLGVTDTFFVSRVSTAAVAAVGLASVLFFSLMLLFRSTAASSIVFVGRAYGAKDNKLVGRVIWNVLHLVALMSVLALSLPWLFSYLFGFLAPADSEVLSLGSVYLQIRAFEVPLAMFNAVIWGFLVGRGDSRTPMFLAWIQVLANIVLDWLLVLGNLGFPALGVAGAAIATVIANLLIVLLSAWLLWRLDSHLHFGTRNYHRPSRQELWQVFRVGVPMGMGDFIEVASFTVFVAMIGRLGTDILAANNIALQYMSLSFTMGIAIAQASSSLVAQYLGAQEAQHAERVGYRASYMAMIVMGLIGIGYFVIPEWLMQVFTQEASVIAAGVLALKVVAFYQVIDAVAIVLGGSLNGAGDTTFTMLAKSILAWGFFIPLTWLFTFVFGWGIAGAWGAALVYLAALAGAYFWRFRSGRWKTLQIT